MKRLTIFIVSVGAVIALAAPALAGPVLDQAAASLRNDPVYVDAAATSVLSTDAAGRIRSHIAAGSVAIYVAALPADVTSETDGSVDKLPAALGQAIGKSGAVGVVTTKSFRAGASSGTGLATGQAGELATLAFGAHKAQGPEAVLQDWISRVQAAVAKNRSSTSSAKTTTAAAKPKKKSHTGLIIVLVLLGLLLAAVLAWIVSVVVRNRREFNAARSKADSKVAKLGAQVYQFSDVTDPDIAEAAERHSWASIALANSNTIEDLEAVSEAADEGRAAVNRYLHRDDPPTPRVTSLRPDDLRDEPAPRKKKGKEVDRPAPAGNTVINNYGDSGQPGYWHGGGFYGGSYYAPGYYSQSNFWQGVMLGEMMSDHDHHDHHDRDDYDREPAHVTADGGDGDYQPSTESGGGDWEPTPEPERAPERSEPEPSHYEAPEPTHYDPPDTSGGGDWGGGGGIDFGGGGGDSGGGGGGGGDW